MSQPSATLTRYVDSLGSGRGDASWDDDGFDGKVAALLADPPAVTSFTFGCPAGLPAGHIELPPSVEGYCG